MKRLSILLLILIFFLGGVYWGLKNFYHNYSYITLWMPEENLVFLVPITIKLPANTVAPQLIIEKLISFNDTDSLPLINPFPSGVKLLGCSIQKNLIELNFSSQFLLPFEEGKEESRLILSALSYTLGEIPGVEGFIINIEGEKKESLGEISLGEPYPVMHNFPNLYLSGKEKEDEKQKILLYYLLPRSELLVPVTLMGSSDSLTSRLERLKRNVEGFLVSPFPPATEILSFKVSGKKAYLNLTSAFLNSSYPKAQAKAILYTLSKNTEIKELQILIEGKKIRQLNKITLNKEKELNSIYSF